MDTAQAIAFIRFILNTKKPQITLRFFYKRKQHELSVVFRFVPTAPRVQSLPVYARVVCVSVERIQRMLLVPDVVCLGWSLPWLDRPISIPHPNSVDLLPAQAQAQVKMRVRVQVQELLPPVSVRTRVQVLEPPLQLMIQHGHDDDHDHDDHRACDHVHDACL